MFSTEIEEVSALAQKKIACMRRSPSAYILFSALAGIYVGFGIILIFAIGGPVSAGPAASFTKLLMGASFGIALSLVVFGGSELFTGNNMVLTIGFLNGKVDAGSFLRSHALCYLGNLAGAFFLAWLMINGGSFVDASKTLVLQAAAGKMNAGIKELFLRGILCNWLVCLAVWTAGRAKSDSAKLIMIFWCLFAFISSGFEHCVANMTLLSLAILLPHGPEISLAGFLHNMLWATLGNFTGGGLFVGATYWLINSGFSPRVAPQACEPSPASAGVAENIAGIGGHSLLSRQ